MSVPMGVKGGVKTKLQYVCQECGALSPKWIGRCRECDAWNSLVEEMVRANSGLTSKGVASGNEPKAVPQIQSEFHARLHSGFAELNRLLGGGIVQGSFVLIGGEPGIGKSTLLLQMSHAVALSGKKVLYISGEESVYQIKGRAERLGSQAELLYVLAEVNLEAMVSEIEKMKPDLVVVDSIQIIYRLDIASSPGSVSQVRECATTLMHLAKKMNVPVFVVGHVNKDGHLAGPKVLEHIVDTVLYFEGDRHHAYRMVRAVKNRFGSTNEMGVFEMRDVGLVEVENPSELFLNDDHERMSGAVVVPCIEGSRPLLVEIQALLTPSHQLGLARRVSTFIDHNRVALLIAIFEKRLGVSLAGQDVFINLVGGIRISEPAADLGVIAAMMSSLRDVPLVRDVVLVGEVGLGGEVRPVTYCERRVMEAQRLGFKRCIVPQACLKNMPSTNLNVVGVRRIEEALEEALSA